MQRARLYDAKKYQLKIPIVKLKCTTCKHLWKHILPLQLSPCGIMDLSLAFWSYKLMLAFGPTNSPPLESNIEKDDISGTR